MNNQNCFDFLIDLALDSKDFAWINQIQELKMLSKNNKTIINSDLFGVCVDEFDQMKLGQALILAHIYHCIIDLDFSSEDILNFICEYVKINPNINDYMCIILNKVLRG